jgi:4-amino-4-deoxy-L-arabinose transferase-like glycosyltransferase
LRRTLLQRLRIVDAVSEATTSSWRIPVAASLLARGFWIAVARWRRGPEAFVVPDSASYWLLSHNLVRGAGFTDWFGNPELFRTPGYPAALLPGVLIGAPISYAIALNVAISVVLVIATFCLARRLLRDERRATACAFVVAIEPTMLTWSLKMMPETLLALCLLLFASAATARTDGTRRAIILSAAAAFALCAAAYVKPVAYPLVCVAVVGALVTPANGWRHRLTRFVAFASVSAALLLPWHVRNARATGYAGFSTIMERAVYLSAGGAVAAQQQHLSFEEMRQKMIDREQVRARVDPQRQARMRREGASRIASAPLAFALIHGRGMLRTMLDPGAVEYLRVTGLYDQGARAVADREGWRKLARAYPLAFWMSIVLAAALLPLIVLPLVAITRLRRDIRASFFVLAMIAGYVIVAGGGVHGSNRFRVAAVPLLVIMSGFAFRSRAPLN